MRVSVVQLCPNSDKAANIARARLAIEACVERDRPGLVVLPEVWTCLGGTREEKFTAAEVLPRPGDAEDGGEAYRFLREMAVRHRVTVHGGSIAELSGDRLCNTSLVFGPDGRELGRYSKIHLFDVTTPNGDGYRESETYRAGDRCSVVRIDAGDGREIGLGLAICYDLRFPELFLRLRREGAELVALPAAFTAETGAAHWEALLRARAIETQCWFAASGTTGRHRDGQGAARDTWGHSMVVDPWGTVVAAAGTGEGWATGWMDAGLTERVRTGIPVLAHRRLA
ncbi:MAG: carbon-nitrogen hydrolase family protein [Gluconacetobacter diazotrophicus]|nr:carbon-nitrogen hydrolase family protein [Gluconacetobacter diazotrophicus]